MSAVSPLADRTSRVGPEQSRHVSSGGQRNGGPGPGINPRGYAGFATVMTLGPVFRVDWYVQPVLVKPFTVNVTDGIDFLESDELLTEQVPSVPVVQVRPPVPRDQAPVTNTPATGTDPGPTTEIWTVAVHELREDVVDPVRPPSHIGVGGGAATVSDVLTDP